MSHRRFHTRMYHGGRVVPDVTWHADPATPAEILSRRRRCGAHCLVLGLILILAGIVYWRFVPEITRDYTDIGEHFKYGSIGTEMSNGVPYWIWKVLPEMFSEYLLDGGKEGYASLGFIIEKDALGQAVRYARRLRDPADRRRRTGEHQLCGLPLLDLPRDPEKRPDTRAGNARAPAEPAQILRFPVSTAPSIPGSTPARSWRGSMPGRGWARWSGSSTRSRSPL